ncbi:MAG: hypothetical protein M3Q22_10105 [Actinomycetota bacterium]|nr:hypothetical protein [Actinomycetota bacterium]
MNTTAERFEEYHRLARQVLDPLATELTNRGSIPPEELQLLLDTTVELPDGRLVTCRQLTSDDYIAIDAYMQTHVRNVTVAADGLN